MFNIFLLGFGNDKHYVERIGRYIPRSMFFFLQDYEFVSSLISRIKEKCNLIGFSTGAIYALKLSLVHEKKINKLILIGIPSFHYLFFPYQGISNYLLRLFSKMYVSLPVFVKRYIYKQFSPNSPKQVIKTVSNTYKEYHFKTCIKYLFCFDTLDALKNITKHRHIHLLVGVNDEFYHFSKFIFDNYNSVSLHNVQGDHHCILNNPLYISLKIQKILS